MSRTFKSRAISLRRAFASKPPPAAGAEFFVAARSSDEDKVLRLSAALGDRVMWTAVRQENIAEMQDAWQKDAAEKIRAANVVVLLVSEDTHASEPIAWELRLADGLRKPVIAQREVEAHAWPHGLPASARRVTQPLDDFAKRFDVLAIEAGLNMRLNDVPVEPLMEQYKLVLESAERLEDRRQSLHAFFVSLNTVLLAAIGLVAKQAIDAKQDDLFLFIPLIASFGAFLCQTWTRQIWSYGQVRRSKFAVLVAMEPRLPAAPFVAEWISLVQRQYESFTESETRVPAAFKAIYFAAAIAAVPLALT